MLLAPQVAGGTTTVRIADAVAQLGRPSATEAQLDVTVDGGHLEVSIGGPGPWALAGLIIQPRRPEIAHLAASGLPAEQDAVLTATATARDGIRGMHLRYQVEDVWHELPMKGGGAAFCATVPAAHLKGDSLAYELVAEDTSGLTAQRKARTAIVHGFQTPVVSSASGPEVWSPSDKLSFRLTLEDGRYAREVRLRYREADQNREFRMSTLAGGRSGDYVFEIDPRHLDGAYDLMYYFELVDVLGGGSFYPDPFRETRYLICRPQ
jgi:hypothetical protein